MQTLPALLYVIEVDALGKLLLQDFERTARVAGIGAGFFGYWQCDDGDATI